MKKIVFGITGLTAGGAERVLVDLSNALKDSYDVTIFTLYGEGDFAHQLDEKVHHISWMPHAYQTYPKWKKRLFSLLLANPITHRIIYNRLIKGKFDLEVAFLEGPITWFMSEKGTCSKIAWIHNDMKQVYGNSKKTKLKHCLDQKAYTQYDQLIFVSDDNLQKFDEIYRIDKPKQVIYNYLDTNRIITLSKAFEPKEMMHKPPQFVAVSRLTEQKGIDRLMRVHKKLLDNYLTHHVYIIGDGPLRGSLEVLQKELKIIDTFHLLGTKENPYPYVARSDFFLLPSYYEGFGMVIIEAEILGKHILLTDTAAREAVKNYPNSTIVSNNEEGLYLGIKQLIEGKIKTKSSLPYQNKSILDQVIKLIEEEIC